MKYFLFLNVFLSISFAEIVSDNVEVYGDYIEIADSYVVLELISKQKIKIPRKYFPKKISPDDKSVFVHVPKEIISKLQEPSKKIQCHYHERPTIVSLELKNCATKLCKAKVHCGSPILYDSSIICEANKDGSCPDAISCKEYKIDLSLLPTKILPKNHENIQGRTNATGI